jgi:pyruvate/2-oxoglutarate dehydrogenase complex dihydrolipoamide acyltransferase (E2) component
MCPCQGYHISQIKEKRETSIKVSKIFRWKESDYISVTLSCDHRTVDGAVGARWLAVN